MTAPPLIVPLAIPLSHRYLYRSAGHVSLGMGFWGAAGFEVDSYKAPLLTARWRYAGARQGAKEMQRMGLTA